MLKNKHKNDIVLIINNEERVNMPMVTCSKCGVEFDSKEKKCPSCGTKNQLKICPVCGAQMAQNAACCPQCGAKNKKPIYKRWYFWILLVCIVFLAFGGIEKTRSDLREDVISDAIVGTWYPYRFFDNGEGTITDASKIYSKVTAKDDYSLELTIEEDTYHLTWSFAGEDNNDLFYTLTTSAGEEASIFAVIPSEDSTLFEDMEKYKGNLIIILDDVALFCRKENTEGYENQNDTATNANNASTSTLGEKNALQKACQYLEYSAFSYTGLIEQLEFEGFSDSEATYAADNCGADWNEQAALKAQQYLEYSAFSKEKLIEQLEFEGFTHSQAVYGVEENGY